jgi:hypothetical protein
LETLVAAAIYGALRAVVPTLDAATAALLVTAMGQARFHLPRLAPARFALPEYHLG